MSAPCNTTVLYPSKGGNIHCFKALTPCALFDVLSPPYSSEDGRHCSYFRKSSRKGLLGTFIPSMILLYPRPLSFNLTLISKACYFVTCSDVKGVELDQLSGVKQSKITWLEEIQAPKNLVVRRGLYKGPTIRR